MAATVLLSCGWRCPREIARNRRKRQTDDLKKSAFIETVTASFGRSPENGEGAEVSLVPFFASLGYPSLLMTAETNTRIAPQGARSLILKRNFLPHDAKISTEIAKDFRRIIAYPPRKKTKPFLLVADWAFVLLGGPVGHPRPPDGEF